MLTRCADLPHAKHSNLESESMNPYLFVAQMLENETMLKIRNMKMGNVESEFHELNGPSCRRDNNSQELHDRRQAQSRFPPNTRLRGLPSVTSLREQIRPRRSKATSCSSTNDRHRDCPSDCRIPPRLNQSLCINLSKTGIAEPNPEYSTKTRVPTRQDGFVRWKERYIFSKSLGQR